MGQSAVKEIKNISLYNLYNISIAKAKCPKTIFIQMMLFTPKKQQQQQQHKQQH